MEKEGSVILERINKRFGRGKTLVLSSYIDDELVAFLDTQTQQETLSAMVELLDKSGELEDKDAFFQAILEREKIVSTGIGIGIAIPHAKLKGYEDFFIAIGIQKGPGVAWEALDNLPVKIIFMIGGPEDRQTEYLGILSMITTAIKDEERRKSLLKATTKEEVIAIFEDL